MIGSIHQDRVMISTPTTLFLKEYETIESATLSFAQANALRDHFQSYLQVARSWDGSQWRLTASHYVGTIVLDDLHIVIRPKCRVENLFFMLTYAYDLPEFRSEESLFEVGEDIFEFIVAIFLRQVQQLIRQGLHRNYFEAEQNQPYLRGRLLLADHLRQNMTHFGRFQQRTNEYSADVRENQILKATLWMLAQLGYRDTTLPRQLRHAYAAFADVSHNTLSARDCQQIHFTRLNQRYQPPIHLSALLLRHLSLESGQGNQRFGTYLFNMNELFERFVGRYLQEHFRPHPSLEVALQDHIWLDDERQEKGIPDIVLRRQGETLCVLDTKYKFFKGKPDSHDSYQMWAYTQRMQAKSGILIYPDPNTPAYQTTFAGIPLRTLALPLDGDLAHFRQRCQRFAEMIAAGT